ncbi:MAG: twin-arginine translocase TatA/TatE family subunit [Rikenellaceae bacterium]|jgi:sec-independent protein translocase protein TatA|nr:twin-arginine translocase TatA/TatE family subunit [Rikenellaceae bacterium]
MIMTLLPLGQIGAPQIILIVALALLLFGGKKIPELMRGVGRGVKEFKDAVNKDYTAEDKADNADEKEK